MSIVWSLRRPTDWALRKYQGVCDTIWGGDAGCAHEWGDTLPRVGNEYREGLGGVCDGRADKGAIRTSLGGARPSTAGNTTPSGFQQKSQAGADGALAQTKWAGTHRVGRNDADRKWKGNDASEVSSGQYCQLCGVWRGQWGLEPSLGQYVANSVEFFAAVHRVMRDDATLWLNLGDSYAGTGSGEGTGNFAEKDNPHAMTMGGKLSGVLKPLDLCGVPWSVAFALRDQLGFYLRSAVVWAKGLSLCPTYSGSVMPESVAGTRWERCRVKVGEQPGIREGRTPQPGDRNDGDGTTVPQWADCPGCPKCESSGGWVLRRGAWRPTNAYEFLFEFAKTRDYYGDGEAVREQGQPESIERAKYKINAFGGGMVSGRIGRMQMGQKANYTPSGSRNLRNVWVMGPEPTALAHYASFPSRLPSLCIQASTSEKGVCPTCGAPWARMIEVDGRRDESWHDHKNDEVRGQRGAPCPDGYARRTVGWRPTCTCPSICADEDLGGDSVTNAWAEPVPAVVLDPCMGTGRTALAARRLGRNFVGCDPSETYCEMARAQVQAEEPDALVPAPHAPDAPPPAGSLLALFGAKP